MSENCILVLGKDDLIHVSTYNNLKFSACESNIQVKKVNPDFGKLKSILWCYECSALNEEN